MLRGCRRCIFVQRDAWQRPLIHAAISGRYCFAHNPAPSSLEIVRFVSELASAIIFVPPGRLSAVRTMISPEGKGFKAIDQHNGRDV